MLSCLLKMYCLRCVYVTSKVTCCYWMTDWNVCAVQLNACFNAYFVQAAITNNYVVRMTEPSWVNATNITVYVTTHSSTFTVMNVRKWTIFPSIGVLQTWASQNSPKRVFIEAEMTSCYSTATGNMAQRDGKAFKITHGRNFVMAEISINMNMAGGGGVQKAQLIALLRL